MDGRRMGWLQEKAAAVGLSDAEAEELGRLYAEAEGKPYSNAEDERMAARAVERPSARRRGNGRWPRLFSHSRGAESGSLPIPVENAETEDSGPPGWKRRQKRAA